MTYPYSAFAEQQCLPTLETWPVEPSQYTRDRYVPALPSWTPAALAWLVVYDWGAPEADRRAALAEIHVRELGLSPEEARALARQTVADPRTYAFHDRLVTIARLPRGYTPCAACGKITRKCPECGECPGCLPASELAACGCCAECARPCARCEECAACGNCECSQCERCGPVENTCGDCDRCDRHCACIHCTACGERVDSTDDDGNCPDCVPSRDDESEEIECTLGNVFAGKPGERLAGLEVEYVRCESSFRPIRDWADKWEASVHSDGSCGWECVTTPAAGAELDKQISQLALAMCRAECHIDKDTCGVHVHVDARDLLWPDIQRLVEVWAKVEAAMFVVAGARRVRNKYCTPWRDRLIDEDGRAKDKQGILVVCGHPAAVLACNWKVGRAPDKKASGRYRAMNLHPWIARLRGERNYPINPNTGQSKLKITKRRASDATIEFRLHEATMDPEELRNWTHLVIALVDYATRATEAEIAVLPRSGMRALCQIVACTGGMGKSGSRTDTLRAWLVSKLRDYTATRTYGQARKISYAPTTGYTLRSA